MDFQEGAFIYINKPYGMSSFGALAYVRTRLSKALHVKRLKTGHAGTLDPLATGLLILCTGPMTKQIEDFQAQIKTYTGTMLLGQTTPTFDLESEPDAFFPTEGITAEQIDAARQQFIGDLKQHPPKYSAIKIKGKRAFDYARSDEEIELKARDVRIEDFKVSTERFPELDFEVTCSKGTYIRSLANDFGKALGNGACLKSLRRTRIGDFRVEDAWQLEALKQAIIDTGEEYRAYSKEHKTN